MKKTNKLVCALALSMGALLSLTSCDLAINQPTFKISSSSSTGSPEIQEVYQAYVDGGGTLSYEEWLATIKGEKGDTGEKGDKGDTGDAGISVKSVTKTSSTDNVDTYTITYSDDTTSTFTVTNGKDGSNGETPVITINDDGEWCVDGTTTGVKATGNNGSNGTSVTITEIKEDKDSEGRKTRTITFSDGNKITITDGKDGADGKDGNDGAAGSSVLTGKGAPDKDLGNDGDSYIDTETFNYYTKAKGAWSEAGNIKGEKGDSGSNGTNGLSIKSIEKTGSNDNVDTYTITYSNDTTSTFTVTNGKTPKITIGEDGYWYVDGVTTGVQATVGSGESGTAVTIGKIEDSDDGKTHTITFSDGKQITITDGKDGEKGDDGNSVLTGEGVPDKDLGNDGDSYINTATFDYYVKKDGAWTLSGNIKGDKGENGEKGDKGDPGEKGSDGTNGTNGSDGLTPYIGENNNWWIGDKDTGVSAKGADGKDATAPTVSIDEDGYWVIDGEKTEVKAKGEDGTPGKDGSDGTNGKDGSSVLTGKGIPVDDYGEDGDSYINAETFDYYVKADGKWAVSGNIKGEKGETGVDGAAGSAGEKGEKGDKGDTGATGRVGFVVNDANDLAVAATIDNAYIVLATDITTDTQIKVTSDAIIDLNGKTLTSTASSSALCAYGKTADVLVKNGTISSSVGGAMKAENGGKLTAVDGLAATAEKYCFLASNQSELVIEGGKYESYDDFVVGSDETTDLSGNTITIDGGTFTGSIKSKGYIACGVYVANSDTVTVSAGTFNITDGVGIVARSGTTTVKDTVTFGITQTEGGVEHGIVGDYGLEIHTGKVIVQDFIAKYNGGDPTVNAPSNWINKITGTFEAASVKGLKDALKTDGCSINLIEDIEISKRLDVNRTVTIDLGSHTIKMKDYKDKNAVGVFNANGEGNSIIVTINNGTIDGTACTQQSGDNRDGECIPIVARNGAKVTLNNMNITIDSITGACVYAFAANEAKNRTEDGTITITSGIYTNKTTEDYPYASGWKALTLDQDDDATTSLISVSGGTFTGMDPAKGDDSGKVSTFISSPLMYKSTLVAGTENTYEVKIGFGGL